MPTRRHTTDIANDLLTQSRPNVLLGGGGNGMTAAGAAAAGYTVVQDLSACSALDTNTATYVSGQFGSTYVPYEYDGLGNLPHLSQMAATALDILDNDPDGFFLMIEGGRIDHAGHANDIQRGVRETAEFANTVQLVLDWAAGRTDTLVLVTADHETGGMSVVADRGTGVAPRRDLDDHGPYGRQRADLRLGAGAEMVTGVLDNTDIFRLTTGIESVGAIGSAQWTGLDLSAGDRWYRGQATRDGLLTHRGDLAGLDVAPNSRRGIADAV